MSIWDAEVAGRLFDPRQALDDSLALGILLAIVAALAIAQVLIRWGRRTGRFSEDLGRELTLRARSWVILVIAIALPILAGAAYTVVAVWLLSLLCYREYARTVGVFRDPLISTVVAMMVTILAFAALDHFDRLFFACSSLGVGVLVVGSVMRDQPKGFIQRVALGVFGFLLFGYSLGYMGLMTNTPGYRALLLSMILAVEANDIFAFCVGKLVGGRRLLPNTSPGKTISGSVGALCLTGLLVAVLFHWMYQDTPLDRWWLLGLLGVLVSAVGQLGDLTLSSIKRDLGIKDFSAVIPGHGGLLDRFDSLVLVPPVVYHFVSLFVEPLGTGSPARILSGG